MTALPEVNACLACDLPKQGHARRWTPAARWHAWIAPTNAMRKTRLKARRAARLGGKP